MSTPKSFLIRMLLAFVVMVSAVFAQAQPVIQGPLSNFDVWNHTGVTTNDFELLLVGILPSQISSTWNYNYPNASITQVGGSTLIRWTGSSTPPGSSSHFGVGLIGIDPAISPVRISFSWSLDGKPIGTLPNNWQYWEVDVSTGEIIRRDVIVNTGRDDIFVRRRVTISTQERMDLDELTVGKKLWEQAKIVDDAPVRIAPGEKLTYDFVMPNPRAWAVMMYEVFKDPEGKTPLMTFLNADNTPPKGAKKTLAKQTKKPQASIGSKPAKTAKSTNKKTSQKLVKA